MEYICLKACVLSGVQYIPGDIVPHDAVPASRVRTLKASGILTDHGPQNDTGNTREAAEGVTIKLCDGNTVHLDGWQVLAVVRTATMESKAAAKAVPGLEDVTVLTVIAAEDGRKSVRDAAIARLGIL